MIHNNQSGIIVKADNKLKVGNYEYRRWMKIVISCSASFTPNFVISKEFTYHVSWEENTKVLAQNSFNQHSQSS